MGFDWTLFITLAKELLSIERNTRSPREEYLRTIISRSYYGIFCVARNYLSSKEASLPEKEIHKFVRSRFISSTNNLENQIGINMDRLWRKRIEADYYNDANINIENVAKVYQTAFRTVEKFRELGAIT